MIMTQIEVLEEWIVRKLGCIYADFSETRDGIFSFIHTYPEDYGESANDH
jgi:hypothetical protein